MPQIPSNTWRRLPEDEDDLCRVAEKYYRADTGCLLPVAGSQAAIQVLPRILPPGAVAMLKLSYGEHEHAWRANGHTIFAAEDKESLIKISESTRHVLICNPNNPTATFWQHDELQYIHKNVQRNGGTLVIDEAFMDATPQLSFVDHLHTGPIAILRSLGKFFGLAGARVGFLLASGKLLNDAREQLGPWTIAGPSRLAACAALGDVDWQIEQTRRLQRSSHALCNMLEQQGYRLAGKTDFFAWVRIPEAANLHEALCRRGILTRLCADNESIRFGLPSCDEELNKLAGALTDIKLVMI